ncbi:MAG: hypothetical protein IKY39_05465 [Clostridia bacterium]|nr:hypothetical protein [Clostridia bacterium]
MNRNGTVQAVLKQLRRDIVFKNLKDEKVIDVIKNHITEARMLSVLK